MDDHNKSQILTGEKILNDLVEILKDMTCDWDMEFDNPIGPDTKLIDDLGFESIDIVQLVVAIEDRFHCRKLPFEEILMVDGRYVDEIKVRDTVDFLSRHLNNK